MNEPPKDIDSDFSTDIQTGDEFELMAACAFGLESVVKRELEGLGIENRVVQPGRVGFRGDYRTIANANLRLRSSDRVFIEVARFEARDFDALFETTKAIDWTRWITREMKFPVAGRSRNSQLTSVPACQRSVKRAIVDSLTASYNAKLPETDAECKIEIALLNDIASLTIDTTGPSLHKRGYRKLVAAAPLKESMAAAMIQLSVWNAERPLVDPFCGSGTIPIEAALIGLNIAPGLKRAFAFEAWPTVSGDLCAEVRAAAAEARRTDIQLQISGTDHDPEVLKLARYHAEQAGVADQIHFQQKSFHELRTKRQYGVLITNPPYGERLQQNDDLLPLYQEIPQVLQRLPTWSHFILTSMKNFEGIVQKKATRKRKLYNGRIECNLFQFVGPRPPRGFDATSTKSALQVEPGGSDLFDPLSEVDDTSKNAANAPTVEHKSTGTDSSAIVFGGLQSKDHEQAELFAARLRNRARHLRRWPTKRGITCYRLYERDVPELPFVVDRYEDSLHITEYERPHERDLARHAAWLELMKKTVASTLQIPIQRVHLKTRQRRHDKEQYSKLADQSRLQEVHEAGLNFLINLTDYVDTGLFLDHRETRSMVRKEAQSKRFLNLFAYTGSFTVYAAAGGAISTTTVDSSQRYLDWAKKNLAANDFSGLQHEFIASDTMQFLDSLPDEPMFDLAVADPPTFSNSKSLDDSWDVQTDHPKLLRAIARRMTPGGVVYFSTNFRRFKPIEESVNLYSDVVEISKQTVPEDFRNRRIHRCWRLVR